MLRHASTLSFRRRTGAYAIDLPIALPVPLLVLFFRSREFSTALVDPLWPIVFYVSFDSVGAAPGKRLSGLRIIDETGDPPGLPTFCHCAPADAPRLDRGHLYDPSPPVSRQSGRRGVSRQGLPGREPRFYMMQARISI